MKVFACRCGQRVYFDNHSCTNCGRQLAFDPATLQMESATDPGIGLAVCSNRGSAIRCNWLPERGESKCLSCRSSEIIPTLSKPENLDRWRKLESAKRRLLYDLLRLKLPVDNSRLRFVFKEDRRTNPDVHEEQVNIGHAEGVITINAAEADEVYREIMRQRMNEPYRTLLGHFRHESGHYYFDIILDADTLSEARELFGDESTGYDDALEQHYRDGPGDNWQKDYVSAYASAHPAEDWAETWAHYLHISSALETAAAFGLIKPDIDENNWQKQFIGLAIGLNEMMRSLGLPDAYPFIITEKVGAKIRFVGEAINRLANRPGAPSSPVT